MFEAVLVANRGEIAVRVMRSCKELGIRTVAVYSEADKDSVHVDYADEAYDIGPSRASESYLDHEAVIASAKEADVDAIHPGYGFLAENAEFAAKVEETDIIWIGPSSDAMGRLGEKTEARKIMHDAGIPIVPGTTEPVTDDEEIASFGGEHGYPVAIKAEGGGGGRGMKIVHGPDEIEDQLQSARREGEAYFGNDSVYVERYLKNPRHVEVQILADEHGNVLHLGERDCSLQRRYQKVVEEGPSPALSEGLSERITEAARRGAHEAGYTNAGTVEFLVEDRQRENGECLGPNTNFYFLEVNTRIQVEHTVTEALTGIDIVKWQIQIAADKKLDFVQDDVDFNGHAMEFRINAENAAEDFAPSAGGTLSTYEPPGGIGVRVDDALHQGEEIVTEYDSMIAKLIVHGQDRDECINRSKRALSEYQIGGVDTIIPFHRLLLEDENFIQGVHSTQYLDTELDPTHIEDAQDKWRFNDSVSESRDPISVDHCYTVEVEGRRFQVSLEDRGPVSGTETEAASARDGGTEAEPIDDKIDEDLGRETITADMQGTILDIAVNEGDVVDPGDVICILEAMKMENEIVASRGGTVVEVAISEGGNVDMGDVLIVIE